MDWNCGPAGGNYSNDSAIVSYFGYWVYYEAGSGNVTYSADGANLYKVSHSTYDVDGNLIESDAYYDTSGYATPLSTYYQFDWQDRQTGILGPDGVATINTLDNLGETTESQTYANATISGGVINYSAGISGLYSDNYFSRLTTIRIPG